ncbi:MAG: hypothetical protein AB8I08_29505 [Sandaracinaceae bacterium]
MTLPSRRPLALILATAAAVASVAVVHAQTDPPVVSDALGAALDEERAWEEARAGRHIKARELAEGVIRQNPESYVGHFVLGVVHHYGEANHARALYHQNRAYRLFVDEFSDEPSTDQPWRWHFRILRELAGTHGDLEHYDEQLRYMARFSELYDPDFIAERAWPFMKQRRFDDAREAVALGRASGLPRQESIALNALCAIEFEAGNDELAYRRCQEAMEYSETTGTPTAVDYTNFAEAARSVFRLDEAERVDLEATEAGVSWYGNPWLELGELYLREGRFAESLNALKQVSPYRNRRPPHVRDADLNESRRALASFFLVVGRADDAVNIAEKALRAPDRRAHNSRDPAQDRALVALLHRAALRLRAERTIEAAVEGGVFAWIGARFSAMYDRHLAWLSGRVASRNLADEERLVGTFMIGSHRSAVMPPWLVVELTDVLGAGVVQEAVTRARAEDNRLGSDAYYDAFEAEAAMVSGDSERAATLAERALGRLDPSEALLRGRLYALLAESARRQGEASRATEAYGDAFQMDPGVFRRLGWQVPARFEHSGSELAEDVADAIAGGPRFDEEDWGLRVRVSGDASRLEACLLDSGDNQLGCATVSESDEVEGDDPPELAQRAVQAFHEAAFAPRIDLSQADANGLDGSNRVSRNPLETLLGEGQTLDE